MWPRILRAEDGFITFFMNILHVPHYTDKRLLLNTASTPKRARYLGLPYIGLPELIQRCGPSSGYVAVHPFKDAESLSECYAQANAQERRNALGKQFGNDQHVDVKESGPNISSIMAPSMELPRILYQTALSRSMVPNHIFEAVRQFASDFAYEFYDDERSLAFLSTEFGPEYVQTYKRLKLGAHKSDFWRYCILYARGGVYLDIKTKLIRPLREVFNRTHRVWYTALGAWCGTFPGYFHQGTIASPPGNPVIKAAIDHIMATTNAEIESNYFCFVQKLYQLAGTALGHPPNPGENAPGAGSGGLSLILFDETYGLDPFRERPDMMELFNDEGAQLHSDSIAILFLTAKQYGQGDEVMMHSFEGSYPWKVGSPLSQTVPHTGTKLSSLVLQTVFISSIRFGKWFFMSFRMRFLPSLLVIYPVMLLDGIWNTQPKKIGQD